MISGVWGKKVGMTQLFVGDKAIPVTAINVAHWIVTQVRSIERDGYSAIQVGYLRDRYKDTQFSSEWLTDRKKYFSALREIKLAQHIEGIEIGKEVDFQAILAEGDGVDVFGTSRGRGFAGVYKRHGFGGAPKSHGSTMGRRSGSISHMRKQGRVIKGKRMAGHMGNVRCAVRNLSLIKAEGSAQVLFVKGAVPGHSGSLVFVRKIHKS
jgi:large subunit ribosomal protein L3